MSFEGYYQILCENGHLTERDVYDIEYHGFKCPYCQGKCAWWNTVDVTNGSYELDNNGAEVRIDGHIDLTVEKSPQVCTCQCGNVHNIGVCTYKFPPPDIGHHNDISPPYDTMDDPTLDDWDRDKG